MENKRKPWKKLTPQEIQNLTNRQCTDCKFYPKSNGTSGKMQTCDYIFILWSVIVEDATQEIA